MTSLFTVFTTGTGGGLGVVLGFGAELEVPPEPEVLLGLGAGLVPEPPPDLLAEALGCGADVEELGWLLGCWLASPEELGWLEELIPGSNGARPFSLSGVSPLAYETLMALRLTAVTAIHAEVLTRQTPLSEWRILEHLAFATSFPLTATRQ